MSTRPRKVSPPPYFWKVPVPEKDHMTENYRRMKNIAADGQRRRHEPLKANFIPGVTKNSRYAHVQSKVGAFLKGEQPLSHRSVSDDLTNRRIQQSQKFSANPNAYGQGHSQRGANVFAGGGGARLSRSSIDLRSPAIPSTPDPRYSKNNPVPLRRQGSISAPAVKPLPYQHPTPADHYGHIGHGPHGQPASYQYHRGGGGGDQYQYDDHEQTPNVRILQPNPPDESIYQWKFNDDPHPPLHMRHDQSMESIPRSQSQLQSQSQCHRVEYFPCDGICADEDVEPDTNLDSARSNSSRTSRGCNTEETRIFPETRTRMQMPQLQQPFHYRSMSIGGTQDAHVPFSNSNSMKSNQNLSNSNSKQTQKGIGGINGFANGNANIFGGDHHAERFENKRTFSEIANRSSQKYNIVTNANGNGNDNGDFESRMRGMDIGSRSRSMPIRGSASETQLYKNNAQMKPNPMRHGPPSTPLEMGAGDLPHSLGTVPKYLKQRQQEWRVEEAAKKEAEENAHVPPGYVLMSDRERMDSLKSFKSNYDELIAELNRIPIRIDTMRVRNHKVDIEKQLERLEDAMKTFSRPKVWVRADH